MSNNSKKMKMVMRLMNLFKSLKHKKIWDRICKNWTLFILTNIIKMRRIITKKWLFIALLMDTLTHVLRKIDSKKRFKKFQN